MPVFTQHSCIEIQFPFSSSAYFFKRINLSDTITDNMRLTRVNFFYIALALSGIIIGVFIRNQIALAALRYQCPDGVGGNQAVAGSTCFSYYPTELSWSNAQTSCQSKGGVLAAIRSQEENDTVSSIRHDTEPWLGASDDNAFITGASEGEYFWADDAIKFWTGGQAGSAVNGAFTSWNGGEPNAAFANEDCIHLYRSGGWNDAACAATFSYVCQFTAVLKEYTDTTETDEAVEEEVVVAPTNGGGVRSATLQKRMSTAILNRATPTHAAPSSKSKTQKVSETPAKIVVTGPSTNSLQERTCSRVMKIVKDDTKMLERVNIRVQNRFGFSCQ